MAERTRRGLAWRGDMTPYQIGLASYYGRRFHGRRTANGERFDMYDFTAAHRALPLGSVIRVTNVSNGRSVRVRVNDRGPYIRGRVLDLSYAAAYRLGMVRSGLARVQIEIVEGE
jgi:rare lipoprotein A